jgi:hypothetical protein
VVQCLEDWATDVKQTEGFDLLIKNDLENLTGEYLVLKYPARFKPSVVQSAARRLKRVHDTKQGVREIEAMLKTDGTTFTLLPEKPA